MTGPRIGLLEEGQIRTLTGVASLAELLSIRLSECQKLLESTAGGSFAAIPQSEVQLLAPLDGRTEVWAPK